MSKILVAEDNAGTVDMLKALLELEGYDVITTSKAAAVIPLLAEECPNVLLMDYFLGQENSTNILQKIRQHPSLKDIPVLVVSGMSCGWEAEKAGADAFLLKPFSVDNLLAVLTELIANSQTKEISQ